MSIGKIQKSSQIRYAVARIALAAPRRVQGRDVAYQYDRPLDIVALEADPIRRRVGFEGDDVEGRLYW